MGGRYALPPHVTAKVDQLVAEWERDQDPTPEAEEVAMEVRGREEVDAR